MIIFGIVGLIFLLIPDQVLTFFNRLSAPLGFMEAPLTGFGFYLILAVGYMYLVTILAYMMFKNPGNTDFPLLLIHGKSASSLLSFALFIVHGQFLIYVTNGIVDGLIALGVFLLFRKVRSAIA
ncbi:hypothetical protein JW960_14970 [candidate division KSB1 bacterium]|nr:hypothetical protein [candidate division KSB1 bacterium]